MNEPASRIRYAALTEVELIQNIEHRAAAVFSLTDLPLQLRHGLSSEMLMKGIRNNNLWVSVNEGDIPMGFALVGIYGLDFHLEEVSVDPDSSRRGHGRSLVTAVIEAAAHRNFARVTLTTFSHILWNHPFYESFGFEVTTDLEVENNLQRKLLEEQNVGLANRVAMTLIFSN